MAADEALDVKYVSAAVDDDNDDGGLLSLLLSLLVVADAVAILEGGMVEADNDTANAEEDADTDAGGANVNEAPNASAAAKEEGVMGVAAAVMLSSLPVNSDIISVDKQQ